MPTFTAVATDTFTGADENPLLHDNTGASVWTTATSVSAMRRISNTAGPSNTSADCASYHSATLNANQYARANMTATSGTGGTLRGPSLRVRQAAGANSAYVFIIDHKATANAAIGRFVTGTFTQLGSSWTQAFTDGDQFTLAVETSGTHQLIHVYDKTNTEITQGTGTAFDDNNASLTSGQAAIAYSSTDTGITTFQFTNFEAGNFSTDTLFGQAVM